MRGQWWAEGGAFPGGLGAPGEEERGISGLISRRGAGNNRAEVPVIFQR